MRRPGRERAGGSARVFVRPMAMLAIGLAAGLVMWRVLMQAGGPGDAAGPPKELAGAISRAEAAGPGPGRH